MRQETTAAEATLLAVMLEDTKPGTHFAAALVDPDGSARVELIERAETGWTNVTTRELTTTFDLVHKFDDFVVTRLPADTSVHNHGTEDGPGLGCRERRLPSGRLRGACMPDPESHVSEEGR